MSAVIIPINQKNLMLLGVISELYRAETNPFMQSGYDILHNYTYERNISGEFTYPVLLRASQDLFKVSENFLTFTEARSIIRVCAMNIRHSSPGGFNAG